MRTGKLRPTSLQQDKRLSRMVIISAVVHAVVIAAIVITATRIQSGPTAPMAYTVELVNPAGLGTNIPSRGGGKSVPRDATEEKTPATSPPQMKPGVKSEPPVQEKKAAEPALPQDKVRLAEPKKAEVKTESEKVTAKQEEKKPEPKKPEVSSLPEKVVLKAAEEKPEPKKVEAKVEPEKVPAEREEKNLEPKKAEAKPDPGKTTPQQETKKITVPSPPLSARTTAHSPSDLSSEERDQKILAALDRIRKQVDEKKIGGGSSGTGRTEGTGPLTGGGAPGEGGGGVVRGLEFIMYTEQVKRHVKESWIVAEKKSGLTAIVCFRVQPDGQIFDVELLKPSGDRAFDESTVRAVRRASPLPPPPQAYLQEFATQKVEISFGGEERTN